VIFMHVTFIVMRLSCLIRDRRYDASYDLINKNEFNREMRLGDSMLPLY
jgi:hypothetical protein